MTTYRKQFEEEIKNGYEYTTYLEKKWHEMLIKQYYDYIKQFDDKEEALYYCVVDYSVYPIVVKQLVRKP